MPSNFSFANNPLSWALPLGRVAGITVRVHVIYLIWIAVELATSGAGGAGWTGFQNKAIALSALFVLVLLHEFGHCFACRRVGGEADDILMWPLGGLASCRPPHNWRASLITTLGGPGVNAVLAPLFGAAVILLGVPATTLLFNPFLPGAAANVAFIEGGWAGYTLWWFYCTNLYLFAFNMFLPMFPMDAGRVLQEVLWSRLGYKRSMEIATTVGLFFAIAVGVWGLVSGAGVLVGIALFAGITCWQEKQRLAWTTAANPWTGNTDEEEPWRRSLKLDDGDDDLPQRGPSKKELRRRREEQASAKAHAEELDRILQKISRDGMGSLTRAERKFLEADTTRRRVQ